jgi:hypothetical protein
MRYFIILLLSTLMLAQTPQPAPVLYTSVLEAAQQQEVVDGAKADIKKARRLIRRQNKLIAQLQEVQRELQTYNSKLASITKLPTPTPPPTPPTGPTPTPEVKK